MVSPFSSVKYKSCVVGVYVVARPGSPIHTIPDPVDGVGGIPGLPVFCNNVRAYNAPPLSVKLTHPFPSKYPIKSSPNSGLWF